MNNHVTDARKFIHRTSNSELFTVLTLREAPMVSREPPYDASPREILPGLRKVELEDEMQASEVKSETASEQKAQEELRCDFCGVSFKNLELSTHRIERGRFCSKICQRKAARRRTVARLGNQPSKRFEKRLRFSNPLYFN